MTLRSTARWRGAGAGMFVGVAAIAGAHVALGGDLRIFLQAEALAVVAGGTLAALAVSFPAAVLRRALRSLAPDRTPTGSLESLVPTFVAYARKARRYGLAALEADVDRLEDAFLARALTLSASGLAPQVVREALVIEARVAAERDDERAQVFEAAAGYAPTLGIVGAVLGLMRVMQHFAGGAVGEGIAAAFVATIYGVGAANLIFLPIATRLRARARVDALRRELVIDGVLALREGAGPMAVEERLSGYLPASRPAALEVVA